MATKRMEIEEIEGKVYVGSFHSTDRLARSLAIKAGQQAIQKHEVEEGSLIKPHFFYQTGLLMFKFGEIKTKIISHTEI